MSIKNRLTIIKQHGFLKIKKITQKLIIDSTIRIKKFYIKSKSNFVSVIKNSSIKIYNYIKTRSANRFKSSVSVHKNINIDKLLEKHILQNKITLSSKKSFKSRNISDFKILSRISVLKNMPTVKALSSFSSICSPSIVRLRLISELCDNNQTVEELDKEYVNMGDMFYIKDKPLEEKLLFSGSSYIWTGTRNISVKK